MTREEFVAQIQAEALRLREAILADETASPALTTLAAEEQVWSDLHLAALEQAGLLRPADQSPPVSAQPPIISRMAILASGILMGPAGQEVRSSGNLLEFFEQLRTWYGDDPGQQASFTAYNTQVDKCGLVTLHDYQPPEASEYDLGLTADTHFEAFQIWVPFCGNSPDMPGHRPAIGRRGRSRRFRHTRSAQFDRRAGHRPNGWLPSRRTGAALHDPLPE